MATDPRKRQKKQERRAAKRKEKKHLQTRREHAGLPERVTAATRFPVLHCWIGNSIAEEGIGHVILSRELPGGQIVLACFLVDSYCLGVKDAYVNFVGRSTYEFEYLRKLRTKLPARQATPAEGRKFVEAAVAYARGLGIAQHPDYATAALLFGDVDPAESSATFEFGKDGKPFFVAGPRDTPERCRQILAILTNTCGPDGFHYLLPLSGPDLDRYLPAGERGGQLLLAPEDAEEDDEPPAEEG